MIVRSVVVMARDPDAGPVKTRLAAVIGADHAAAFYRKTLDDILGRLETGDWNLVLAVTPPVATQAQWMRGHRAVAQGDGDLGDRMQCAINAMPPGPVVVVGSDIPDLAARHVLAAFDLLAEFDVVFGPARDGGYWLIGVSSEFRSQTLFGPVRWSSEHALHDTRAYLPAGARVVLTEELSDVDTWDDYQTWSERR